MFRDDIARSAPCRRTRARVRSQRPRRGPPALLDPAARRPIGRRSGARSSASAPDWPPSQPLAGWLGPAEGPGQPSPTRRPAMTALTHELKARYAFVERNFFLSRRYWGWEIAFLVYSAAGALSISLIGAQPGDPRLLLSLMIGAIFWNYLSVVFSWIAETIAIERWEGTLEYTMMAPVRRSTHLLGSCVVRHRLRPDPHRRDPRRGRPVLPAARPARPNVRHGRSSWPSARSASSASG